jgi:hypothetical protein
VKKSYMQWLDHDTRLVVHLRKSRGRVLAFVVKLMIRESDGWVELERYDMFHGFVHRDIMDRGGNKIRTIPYFFLDSGNGLTTAIQDYKNNFDVYGRGRK